MKKENEIKTTETKETKIENILYDKYLEVWKTQKSDLHKTPNKKQIESNKLKKLLKSEIDKLSKINDLSGFKLFMSNNKPLAIYRDKNIFYTTISMCVIKNRNDTKFKQLIEVFKNGTFQLYRKENRVFVRCFYKGMRKFSDKRLFIFNFSSIERLNSELQKIKNGALKEKKSKDKKKKEKELKSIEI